WVRAAFRSRQAQALRCSRQGAPVRGLRGCAFSMACVPNSLVQKPATIQNRTENNGWWPPAAPRLAQTPPKQELLSGHLIECDLKGANLWPPRETGINNKASGPVRPARTR